ncbi:acid phosphatase (class A) [Brevundimonas nasdae]|uniref:acid phosphatase n=1 Tax=Brevundimonas nasdae TaxID=172043 RepID=UPI001912E000|nr:phosphatase PAP2 family protein [Brevundimonas nasdae]MBK6024902.1 phosphatase PAP2 family protein [Brevundimonas nasdae]MDQ0451764.1 acid phosphatase (class A) [Brevundimonas nasdae]
MKFKTVCAVAVLLTAAGCASAPAGTTSVPTSWEGFRDHPHGYLAKDDAPDASAFLPPPPEAGSLRQQDDVAIYHATRALEGSDRWRQAAADNEIETPSAPRIFSAALGVDFDPVRMPTLALLLGRMLGDLETIQTPAKQGYFRPRPFVAEPLKTCIAPEPWLSRSGSYPSGHSALGWAWALVLAELAPDRADAILTRGLAYGESRIICGVHYASDVEAGRLVGAAIVARLQADPTFKRDLEVARAELNAARVVQPTSK